MSYDLIVDWKGTSSQVASKEIIKFYAKNGLDIAIHPDACPYIDLGSQTGLLPIVLKRDSKFFKRRFDIDLCTGVELYPTEPNCNGDGAMSVLVNMHYNEDGCVEFLCGFMFAGAIASIFGGIVTDPQTPEKFTADGVKPLLDVAKENFWDSFNKLSSDGANKIGW